MVRVVTLATATFTTTIVLVNWLNLTMERDYKDTYLSPLACGPWSFVVLQSGVSEAISNLLNWRDKALQQW